MTKEERIKALAQAINSDCCANIENDFGNIPTAIQYMAGISAYYAVKTAELQIEIEDLKARPPQKVIYSDGRDNI